MADRLDALRAAAENAKACDAMADDAGTFEGRFGACPFPMKTGQSVDAAIAATRAARDAWVKVARMIAAGKDV